jgi:hypothetical protein
MTLSWLSDFAKETRNRATTPPGGPNSRGGSIATAEMFAREEFGAAGLLLATSFRL